MAGLAVVVLNDINEEVIGAADDIGSGLIDRLRSAMGLSSWMDLIV